MEGLHWLESVEGTAGRGPSVEGLGERKRSAGGVEGTEPWCPRRKTEAEEM